MGCQAMWARRVATELAPHYPDARFILARAYARPHALESGAVIPGIERPEDQSDPIRALRKWLALNYSPGIAVQYHPRGGFAWVQT